MIKKIKYFFQSILILLFFFIIKILRIKLSRKIFSNLFLVLGPIFKSNKVIMSNLDKIHKFSFQEKKEIKNKMWKNYGKIFSEYMYLEKFRTSNYHIKIKGEEILKKIFKEKKPVIFVSGHFANFELMSMELTKREINLATIYRPLNNYFLNPLMEKIRKNHICKKQVKKGLSGTREILKYFKNGTSLALMIDQRLSEGIESNFFKKKASTTTIPAQFVIKFKADIIPVYIERLNNNNFKISFHNAIHFSETENINDITYKLNVVLEKMIVQNPSQWIWTHDRWK